MTELTASRTLVKSRPELWTECSDAASLARHLDQFGEIRITRLEPETAVAWEGESARGTVRLEPSGWGTRVILTAHPADVPEPEPPAAAELPAPAEQPEAPAPVVAPPGSHAPWLAQAQADPPPPEEEAPEEDEEKCDAPTAELPVLPSSGRLFARMRRWFRRRSATPEEPEPVAAEPEPAPAEPEPAPAEPQPTAPEPEPAPADPEPVAIRSEPAPAVPEPAAADLDPDAEAALERALESLGRAHHRPFSRA